MCSFVKAQLRTQSGPTSLESELGQEQVQNEFVVGDGQIPGDARVVTGGPHLSGEARQKPDKSAGMREVS